MFQFTERLDALIGPILENLMPIWPPKGGLKSRHQTRLLSLYYSRTLQHVPENSSKNKKQNSKPTATRKTSNTIDWPWTGIQKFQSLFKKKRVAFRLLWNPSNTITERLRMLLERSYVGNKLSKPIYAIWSRRMIQTESYRHFGAFFEKKGLDPSLTAWGTLGQKVCNKSLGQIRRCKNDQKLSVLTLSAWLPQRVASNMKKLQ